MFAGTQPTPNILYNVCAAHRETVEHASHARDGADKLSPEELKQLVRSCCAHM